MGGGIYDTDGTDPEEATGLLEPEDTLSGDNALDTAYSPADRPWAVTDWGMTEREESAGESLAGRLARELPDTPDDDAGDGLGDVLGTDGELRDDEVGDLRAGRLSEGDDRYGDDEPELWAEDEGIDGAGASAEEAAVHVVRDEDR